MSINESQYRIDLNGIQSAVGYAKGQLAIGPEGMFLVTPGNTFSGVDEIAKALDEAGDAYYDE